jgi:hypothetical protein
MAWIVCWVESLTDSGYGYLLPLAGLEVGVFLGLAFAAAITYTHWATARNKINLLITLLMFFLFNMMRSMHGWGRGAGT